MEVSKEEMNDALEQAFNDLERIVEKGKAKIEKLKKLRDTKVTDFERNYTEDIIRIEEKELQPYLELLQLKHAITKR